MAEDSTSQPATSQCVSQVFTPFECTSFVLSKAQICRFEPLTPCRTAERPQQKQAGQAPSGNRGAARQRVHPEVHREALQFFACQPRKLAEEVWKSMQRSPTKRGNRRSSGPVLICCRNSFSSCNSFSSSNDGTASRVDLRRVLAVVLAEDKGR